jgi:DAPkinase-like Roc (Ras of Complex) protein
LLQKKICMLGAFSVGKTTLVKRYVESVFSEKYITTVGVKIDKKVVDLPNRTVNLILWDMAGEDDASTIRMSYLRERRCTGQFRYGRLAAAPAAAARRTGTRRRLLDCEIRLLIDWRSGDHGP